MPLPHACSLAAPPFINVHSDGSWLHPLKKFLGLGGAGVWWPNRILKNNGTTMKPRPLSIAEYHMAMHTVEEDGVGVRLYTNIGGYSGSSTRTELAAGIIALCAEGPVHIGSDSEVFVKRANQLIQQVADAEYINHNWKFTSDGDLWEHFYKALAKGFARKPCQEFAWRPLPGVYVFIYRV